jgi:hypothetical protein
MHMYMVDTRAYTHPHVTTHSPDVVPLMDPARRDVAIKPTLAPCTCASQKSAISTQLAKIRA